MYNADGLRAAINSLEYQVKRHILNLSKTQFTYLWQFSVLPVFYAHKPKYKHTASCWIVSVQTGKFPFLIFCYSYGSTLACTVHRRYFHFQSLPSLKYAAKTGFFLATRYGYDFVHIEPTIHVEGTIKTLWISCQFSFPSFTFRPVSASHLFKRAWTVVQLQLFDYFYVCIIFCHQRHPAIL